MGVMVFSIPGVSYSAQTACEAPCFDGLEWTVSAAQQDLAVGRAANMENYTNSNTSALSGQVAAAARDASRALSILTNCLTSASRRRKSLAEVRQKCSECTGVGFEGNQSHGVPCHHAGLSLWRWTCLQCSEN